MSRSLLTIGVFVLLAAPGFAQFATEAQRREAWRHYRAGQELMAGEQFERAAEAFQRAIDGDRLLTLAYYGQGQAYMALQRFASAARAFAACRDAFRTLHELAENHRQAAENRRDADIRALRELAGAAADTRRAAITAYIGQLERQRTTLGEAFEPPAFVSLALGSAYFRNGQLEDAEREWKAAVAAAPRFGEAHNNLAALYAMTGRRVEAEDALRAAEASGFRVHPQLKADISSR